VLLGIWEERPLKFFTEKVGCWRAKIVNSRRWIVYRIGVGVLGVGIFVLSRGRGNL
jgi:hypothetical protein